MIRYRINTKTILSIEGNVILKIMKYRQKQGMHESGGILLGKVRNDYSELIITDISEPCIKDKSGRCYFIRNKENAQMIINKEWEKSNGEINYLGEWHTHPEINPNPSFIDRRLLKQCIKKNKYPFHGLFMIIVGTNGHLYVGYQAKTMRKQKQLQRIKE
ncbi:MAG: hypothetical protein FH761_08275 [Firmicutes bacterium]|nr:hypothetical protein [Bacillota bacterium]